MATSPIERFLSGALMAFKNGGRPNPPAQTLPDYEILERLCAAVGMQQLDPDAVEDLGRLEGRFQRGKKVLDEMGHHRLRAMKEAQVDAARDAINENELSDFFIGAAASPSHLNEQRMAACQSVKTVLREISCDACDILRPHVQKLQEQIHDFLDDLEASDRLRSSKFGVAYRQSDTISTLRRIADQLSGRVEAKPPEMTSYIPPSRLCPWWKVEAIEDEEPV